MTVININDRLYQPSQNGTSYEDCHILHIHNSVIYGCTDLDACNYDVHASEDYGSCDYGYMCWGGSYECDESKCPKKP